MATSLLMRDGDIAIETDGSSHWTTDLATETAQRLQAKYGLWLGEWFLDLREGVPYYRDVLGRNRNLTVVQNVLRRVAATDPGIDSLPIFDVQLDSGRMLSVNFTAVLTTGQVLSQTLEPFTV